MKIRQDFVAFKFKPVSYVRLYQIINYVETSWGGQTLRCVTLFLVINYRAPVLIPTGM